MSQLISYMQTPLSKHFSWEEVTKSAKATELLIPNTLPEIFSPCVQKLAELMESVRSILGGKPIQINSWYRNSRLNTAVGGSPTSDHMSGEAVDFICPAFGSPLLICKAILSSAPQIQFKQLILEHSWVHISLDTNPSVKLQKYQVLSLLSGGKYAIGLTDINGNKL